MMKTLTVPFAILSDDGHMLWGNDEFVSVIVNKKAARRNISNIFEEITIDSLPDSDEIKVIHVKTEDKYYRAVMKLIVSDSPDDEMVKTDINQLMDNSRLISVFVIFLPELIFLLRLNVLSQFNTFDEIRRLFIVPPF